MGPYARVSCPGCGEEFRVKTELESYRLMRKIASGERSVVFAARDLALDREIAVKVLGKQFAAEEKREADFRWEACLTAALSHQNVVPVYTVGRAFGRYFIAMELVRGYSLDERISAQGALPEEEVVEIALDAVDGLRAAKSKGLIHRDLRPGNILFDEDGKVKIVDFGISLLMGNEGFRCEENRAILNYVAPEVLECGEEDHLADIYALGATLYHALAGVPPVEFEEVTNQAALEAKEKVRALKQVAPWLSNGIVRIVEQAMSHDPTDRFEDYEEFRISLEMCRVVLEAKGSRAPLDSAIRAQRRERDYVHRKGWLTGIAVTLVVSLLMVSYFYLKLTRDGGVNSEPAGGSLLVIDPDQNPAIDPEVARLVNEAYAQARQALASGDFLMAEQGFLRAWSVELSPAPTAAWAGFEAAIAAFLDGRGSDARQRLAAVFDFVNEARLEDTVLGRRLQSAAELLTSLRFVPEERVPDVLNDPFRATVFFAMALKTWEQGDLERAHRMFAKILEVGSWPEAEWMSTYQQLARHYVEDHARLAKVEYLQVGKSRSELERHIESLDKLYTSLNTRGRARFNVKVRQSKLKGRLRQLQTGKVEDAWLQLRDEVAARYFLTARFTEGAEALTRIELNGELERGQRAALLLLSTEAAGFIDELSGALRPGADALQLKTRSGVEYTEVLGSEPGGLMVDNEGTARSLPWRDIEPLSLLVIHRRLVEASTSEEEKAARLLRAAAFAWLNGFKGKGRGMVQELIAVKPEFEVQWEQIMEDFGEAAPARPTSGND